MRAATKFVAPITDEERLRLKEIHKTDPNWRTGMRAQAILLSEKGFAINQLATIFEIDRNYISQWLEKKPALIVLDNAPVDASEAFESRIEGWQEQGRYLLLLPPYCPELNVIEILWRKMKYEWLPGSANQSFKYLSEARNKDRIGDR